MRKLLTFPIAAVFVMCMAVTTAPALAQVKKCVGADGRVVYSDRGCGEQGQDVQNLNANTVGAHQVPVQRALPGAEPAVQRVAQPVHTKKCPSEQEIRNLQTSASSVTIKRAEKEFLLQEVARAKACETQLGDAGRRAAVSAGQAQEALETEQLKKDKAARAQAAADSEPLVVSCHNKTCTDQQGRTYTSDGTANVFRSDGKMCRRVGPNLTCS